jgi:hypothetical protein
MADFQTKYIAAPCSHSLQFSPFNMEVVHMDRCGICVCVQHPPAVHTGGGSGGGVGAEQQDPNSSGISSGAVSSVSYTVFVLHHGCTLTYTIPLARDRICFADVSSLFARGMVGGTCVLHSQHITECASNHTFRVLLTFSLSIHTVRRSPMQANLPVEMLPDVRIHFSSLNGLLLAYVPGHAMQLVDCGTLLEPCHHLILLDDEVQTLPGYSKPDPLAPVLPPAITYFELVKQDNGRNAYGVAMFDVKNGVAYTYSIDPEAVFAIFANGLVRVFDRNLRSKMPLVPTPLLGLKQACV